MAKKQKKFKLVDAVLATVCITLVCESVAPTAAIGNSQYFWWIFLILAFCLPYGLITAELGTTFESEGGMYDWVKKAFGKKMAARVAWNYWINFPLWIASLAVAVTDVVAGIFEIELGLIPLLILQLGYTWLVTFLSTSRISDNKYFVNIGTFFKIAFMIALGFLGIFVWVKTGQSANPIQSVKDLFPADLMSLSFVSIIIFNFLGFEVVATFANDMENPKKEIPKALIVGGAIMAIFYILPATGVNVAMSLEDAEVAGITESFALLLGSLGAAEGVIRAVGIGAGLMFIYTMVANIVSWSFGVNSVAKYAADDGSMPAVFKGTNKEGVPTSAAIMNGVVASVIVVAGVLLGQFGSESANNLFWTFFSLSLVTLLLSYVPLFAAFLKLRKTDKTPRIYKVPGNNFVLNLMTWVPLVLLIASLVFTIFIDFTMESLKANAALIVGVIVSVIIQEILAARVSDKKTK